MNDNPTSHTPPLTVPVRIDDEVIGHVEPVQAHGERHWRFVTTTGYRSPFNHRNQNDSINALVSHHLSANDPGLVQSRLEPVDGADGVAGHDPMFEVYRCPPGCPDHPPVVVCSKDRETWPCTAVQAVCAELDRMVVEFDPSAEGEWAVAATMLQARCRALATAGGVVQ